MASGHQQHLHQDILVKGCLSPVSLVQFGRSSCQLCIAHFVSALTGIEWVSFQAFRNGRCCNLWLGLEKWRNGEVIWRSQTLGTREVHGSLQFTTTSPRYHGTCQNSAWKPFKRKWKGRKGPSTKLLCKGCVLSSKMSVLSVTFPRSLWRVQQQVRDYCSMVVGCWRSPAYDLSAQF